MASSFSVSPKFSHARTIRFQGQEFKYTVYDGSVGTLAEVHAPKLGDVWVGRPTDGQVHDIHVFGELKGEAKAFKHRTPINAWTPVPQNASCDFEYRYRLPAVQNELRARFLDMQNASAESLKWITRDNWSNKGKRNGTSDAPDRAHKRSKQEIPNHDEPGVNLEHEGAPRKDGETQSPLSSIPRSSTSPDPSGSQHTTDHQGPLLAPMGPPDSEHTLLISQLIEEWENNSFICSLPTHGSGVAILRLLREKFRISPNISPIPIFDTKWKSRPTLAHVIVDLTANSQSTIPAIELGKYTSSKYSGQSIAASHMGLGDQPGPHGRKILNVLVVRGTPSGLGHCLPEFQGDLQARTTYIEPKVDEDSRNPFQFDSSLVSAGSISSIHLDFHSVGQLIVHYVGKKLWLFWPPTEHNLEKWTSRYQRAEEQTLEDYRWAIGTLEDMQYALVDTNTEDLGLPTRKTFLMPPYTLHLVFTFTQSAHGGAKLVRHEWFDDVKRCFEWDVESLYNPESVGSSTDISQDEGPLMQEDVEMWGHLADLLKGIKGKGWAQVAKQIAKFSDESVKKCEELNAL